MSAEAFDTPLTADLATAPDGRAVLVAVSGSRQPRAFDSGSRHAPTRWAACHLNAEMAVRVAAETVRSQVMEGLTGDHPDEREFTATLLHAVADLVRDLALDHACDGAFVETMWTLRLDAIRHFIAGGSYPGDDLSSRATTILLAPS